MSVQGGAAYRSSGVSPVLARWIISCILSQCVLPDQDWVPEEGMVFHMYSFAQGIPFSETAHVTANGPDPLTGSMPRRLSIL